MNFALCAPVSKCPPDFTFYVLIRCEVAVLILVTNDDGVHSPGILVLAEQLATLGEVVVVAPDRERSAVSHALTLHAPLRADELSPGFFAVDGTPTDCVNLAIHGLLGRKPDLVVSGINRGGNMGDDLTYSGTVAAAMEATLMGVPALAFSLEAEHVFLLKTSPSPLQWRLISPGGSSRPDFRRRRSLISMYPGDSLSACV